jgi:hypothetical protein
MYWYILILSILFLLIVYYTQSIDGFTNAPAKTNLVSTIANIYSESDPPPSAPALNAFGSNSFHGKSTYFIDTSSEVATNSLVGDIQFCMSNAQTNDPFSDSRFADTCGICMTQGTVLLQEHPFSQATQRKGTGVVVYKQDKQFSLRERTQAIPSAHSAFCDTLFINSNSLPSNVSLANITGLAVTADQYRDTLAYLNAVNLLSFANTTNCAPTVSQPIVCERENTTVGGMRFLYGHFNDSCESNSPPMKTEVTLPPMNGVQSFTFSSNLPAGQRQWYLNAECKVQEESIPEGLPQMHRRTVSGMGSSMSNLSYYWASPYSSIDTGDVKKFTLYGSCDVAEDTQVRLEYSTNAGFDLYLHSVKQYTQANSGSRIMYQPASSSPAFTLYKGNNVIRLAVTSTQGSKNGLYLKMYTMNGSPVATLDSTWVYSLAAPSAGAGVAGFTNPSLSLGRFPVNSLNVWSNIYILFPKNPSTTTINYVKEITLESEQMLTLATVMFTMNFVEMINETFSYSVYLSYKGIEKKVLTSKNNEDRVQAYTEYFPAGMTRLRISVQGDKSTCIIGFLSDANKNIVVSMDGSSTCDEPPAASPSPSPSPQAIQRAVYTVEEYFIKDFYTKPSIGGTLAECEEKCTSDPLCLGFARHKNDEFLKYSDTSTHGCVMLDDLTHKDYSGLRPYPTHVKHKV